MFVPFRWRELSLAQRNSMLAAGLCWFFSGFDVMLYSALLPRLLPALEMSKSTAGLLNALMLVGDGNRQLRFWPVGGSLWAKARAHLFALDVYFLHISVRVRSQYCTLAVCRFAVGLGMGGEWTCGAALLAESWPSDRRARAMGIVQSGYAIGYALAVVAAGFLAPILGWRGVFFLGILPVFFAVWLRRNVEEPSLWKAESARISPGTAEGKAFVESGDSAAGRLALHEYIWIVRLVGLVQLDAGLPGFATGARRARFSFGEHSGIRGFDQCRRDGPGIFIFRRHSGPLWPKANGGDLFVDGRGAGAVFRDGASAGMDPGGWSDHRVFGSDFLRVRGRWRANYSRQRFARWLWAFPTMRRVRSARWRRS